MKEKTNTQTISSIEGNNMKKDNDPILDFLSFIIVITALFVIYFAFYIGTVRYRGSKQELPEIPVDIRPKLSGYLVTNS